MPRTIYGDYFDEDSTLDELELEEKYPPLQSLEDVVVDQMEGYIDTGDYDDD